MEEDSSCACLYGNTFVSHVHIIGGGLAGLSAAVELAPQAKVTLYEAGPACGGRARSFYDRSLDTEIDNGNHLFLSANRIIFRYLDIIGARGTLKGSQEPIFPWFDLSDGTAWSLRLSSGKIPFWLFSKKRRVPGMRLKDALALQKIMKAKEGELLVDYLPQGSFTERLLKPLAISALNTPVEEASARLFGTIIKRTLAQSGKECTPWMAANGLSKSFVEPALTYLERYHGTVKTGMRVSNLGFENGRLSQFETSEGIVRLGAHDYAILAVPAPVAAQLLPDLRVPNAFESIINLHYRLEDVIKPIGIVKKTRFIGLVGGIAEWVFLHDDILSVTISAANQYQNWAQEALAEHVWKEISRALNPILEEHLPASMPKMRFIKEKRASFAATPEQEKRRPMAETPYLNLALAGDWTQTSLPSTIEGALQSGLSAVKILGFRAGS